MTLVQLEYYIGACEYKSMTRAAKQLNVTQPTLSNAIKQLESEYGSVFILRRQNGENTVTESGKLFYEFAKSAVAEINRLERDVKLACSKKQ